MSTNRSGAAQRPNGAPQTKVCQFKLVLLGESAVGKSSLVLRFVKGQFHEYQESTIGAAFLTQTLCLDDTTVKFEIWDTAGQERYHSLAPMYYRGAQAAIVVYDITNQDTFGRAKNWVKELQRQASPSIVIALAGNKSDLAAKRMVEFEEAQAYADENGLLFMETSAKTAMNVNDIFLAIANKLPKSEGGGGGGARLLLLQVIADAMSARRGAIGAGLAARGRVQCRAVSRCRRCRSPHSPTHAASIHHRIHWTNVNTF